jgi:hypothetical protein
VTAGFVEYIPHDTSLPTYAGTYREKLNGVLLELSLRTTSRGSRSFG